MFVAMLPFLYSLELHLNARDIPLCQGNSGSGMCSSGNSICWGKNVRRGGAVAERMVLGLHQYRWLAANALAVVDPFVLKSTQQKLKIGKKVIILIIISTASGA